MGRHTQRSLAGLCLLLLLPVCSDTRTPPGDVDERDAPDSAVSDLVTRVDGNRDLSGPELDVTPSDAPQDAPAADGPPPPDGPTPPCGSWGDWTCSVAGQGCIASCTTLSIYCSLGACTCTDPAKLPPIQCTPVTPDLDGCQQCKLALSQGCCTP